MTIDTLAKDWWRNIDITTFNTIDDCNEAICALDEVVGSLYTQIEGAKIKAAQGSSPVDEDWFHSVNSAHGHAKKKRKEITTRREGLIQVRGQRKKDEMLDFYQLVAKTIYEVSETLKKIEAKL